MDADLGLSDTMFGFGAGVFFLAYFVFEVPSNLLLNRFGARRWIARIMLSWGISGAMAFIPQIASTTGLSNEHTFYLLRVLLGFAEAGFFPGIIFFLTLSFPSAYRARIVGYFMAAIPLSSAIGSPISASLLLLGGVGGLAGWQWLFVMEAALSIVLAFVTLLTLPIAPPARPGAGAGKARLDHVRLEAEERQRASAVDSRFFGKACSIHACSPCPSSISAASRAFTASASGCRRSSRDFGLHRADRMDRRDPLCARHHRLDLVRTPFGRADGAHRSCRERPRVRRLWPRRLGLSGKSLSQDGRVVARLLRRLRLLARVLDAADRLPLRRRCGGGHRGDQFTRQSRGYFGPYIMGWIKDQTGSFAHALLAISACAAIAMAITIALGHNAALERAPEAAKVGSQARA